MGLTKPDKLAKNIANRLEKKRLAFEAKKSRKREELQREIDSHLLSKDQVKESLRDTMLRIKIPAYRQQIEVMWHSLDRAYDKKDDLINYLMHLRNIANHQYQQTLGDFSMFTDKIIITFLTDLEELCKKNNIKIADMLKFGREELEYYLEHHKKAETHVKLMIYASHEAADSLAWNTRGHNVVRIDEDANTFSEMRDTLGAVLEGNYCWIWEDYKSTLRGYVRSTCENQKLLRQQRKKVKMTSDLIAAQGKQLINNEKIMKRLRVELVAYETGEKQAGYRDRRNRHRNAYYQMKQNLKSGIEKDTNQLAILVKASDDAVDWIAGARKKSEKILRLAAECRKYETQREKIMPYGSGKPQEQVKTHARLHSDEDPLVFEALPTTCGLARIWHRLSEAELTKRVLIKEKMSLERENAWLESMLKEQDKENINPMAVKCDCCKPSPIKKQIRSNNQPCALDGTLEYKKYLTNNVF